MGFGSIWHWVIVLMVVLVLFGRGRVSEIMGDFGKGIKSFKQGLGDDEKPVTPPPAQLPATDAAATPTASETTTNSSQP